MVEKGEDADISSLNLSLLETPQEKAVLLLLAEYEQVVMRATKDNNPAVMTKYCFDVAQAYNDFYHHCKVIDESQPELTGARLLLSRVTRDVLKDALSLLTIDTVERM